MRKFTDLCWYDCGLFEIEMRVNEDGREVNWRWEEGKLMGIREKIRKGIKGNYNVNAIYFMGWEGNLEGDLGYGKCITRGWVI